MSPRAAAVRAAGAAAAVLGLVSCGGAAPSGVPVPSTAAAPAVATLPSPDATAAGLAVVLPGSGWEDAGATGLTLLSALAVMEEARGPVEALGGELGVVCGRWSLVVTLVAPEGTWREAAGLLAAALSRPEVTTWALERARASLTATLSLDHANPAWQARLAASRALWGNGGPGADWSRPPCGVVEALDLFGPSAVEGMAARLGSFASVAAAGAVGAGADSVLRTLFRPGGAAAILPLPGPPSPGRVYVERNTVTAWVAVAWPFGREADVDAVRLVGALLEEEVGPDVTRPGVLHASSEVELHGEGGALVVTVVAVPERAAAVAAALDSAVVRLAAGRGSAAQLERVSRRHRGERLRALAAPESRAIRVAVERARGGVAGPWPERASYTAEAVRKAAAALGQAARAVVGPGAARAAVVP